MDTYSGIRSAGAPMSPKKGHSSSLKDASADGDQNIKFCNRIGCNGRMKYDFNTKLGTAERSKGSNTSHSSHGNKVDGNCYRSNALISSSKITNADSKRKLSAQVEIDRPESSRSGDSYTQEPLSLPNGRPTGYQMEVNTNFGNTAVPEIGSSSTTSNMRHRKLFQIKSAMQKQNTQLAASVLSVSRSSVAGSVNNGNGSRYNLRNLKRNSVHDIASSSSSVSKSTGKRVMEKGTLEQEGTSSQSGRNITSGSSVDGYLTPSTINNLSSNSRQSSVVAGEDTSGSTFRSRRSVNISNKMRLSYRQNMRNSALGRIPMVGCPDSEMPTNVGRSNLSQNFSSNGYSSGINSNNRSSNTGDDPSAPSELHLAHLRNCEAWQRYNIAEVLLALERIEQNEETTYEQHHALETRFFIGGLRLNDQHRDMRLDIDNMSYEDLLALEERMGSVSTAVSEEALVKCLKRSVFQEHSLPCETKIDEDGDDIKCSICQEEYAPGDEIGNLVECQHGYHVSCVKQWLRVKNWCPICKAAAVPSH